MTRPVALGLVAGAVLVAALAAVPWIAGGYGLALWITLLNYTVLATAWALFSGPTRYVSLATVAFFGIGNYVVGVFGEALAWPAVLALAAGFGALVAVVVGVATLRLSGMYFVVFTFGLSELVRQVVTWWEVNITRTVGRYVFLDITQEQIYWQLLALTAGVFLVGWLVNRSRYGLALRVIGDDELVARHCGINTTALKLALFAVSAAFIAATGAVMAPRWTYIDPAIAFNPVISFLVVIMALLGGAGRLYGPVLGAVPLALLFEFLSANFPNYFSILLGVVFMIIVYFLPNGVVGFVDAGMARLRPGLAAAGVAPPGGARAASAAPAWAERAGTQVQRLRAAAARSMRGWRGVP